MKLPSIDMTGFNRNAKVYWWLTVIIGSLLTVGSAISLHSFGLGHWLRFAMLASLVVMASRRPLHIPNTEASVSVSDSFVFLGLFFLGIGPAILLGALDNFIAAQKTARRAASLILAPALMAITVLSSSLAFKLTLGVTHKGPIVWPIGDGETYFASLFPALIVLALVQYLMNGWLVALFYAIRANKSAYLFWRSGYLWTSWTFFASAIAAGLIYLAVERHGFICVAAAVPIMVASYLTYKVYFDRLNENKRHLEEMNRLHLATVEALASAIDAKDQTTHGHVRRVQIYAEGLAKLFNLLKPEVEALRAGALLHDIGKLAVPDHILNKPSKLTAAEFEKMKIHTIVGAQILERVGFPYPVVPIVRYHHERWDGNGYPDSLSGEQIPITARILSVVDCFDALHEDRQYRRALTRDQAITHLQHAAGTQFDPEIVRVFIEHLDEFEAEIAAQHVENEPLPAPAISVRASGALPAAGLSSELRIIDTAERPSYMSHISRAHQEVYALYEVARTFGSSLNIEDAMAIIANKLGYVVSFDTCVIYRFHEATGVAIAEHVSGQYAEHLRHRCVVPGEGITGYVLANRKAFAHTDPMLDFANVDLPPGANFTGCAVLPLLKKDRLLGALALYAASGDYSEDDLRLLETVARIAADALDNAIRYASTRSEALTDLLTGVPNSRALQLRFEQEAIKADTSGNVFYLLMLDLDGFKPINDTYGHQIGDDFLRAIAQMLQSHFGRFDFFSRYAGDEFVALVTHVDERQCVELCARLQRAVQRFAFCVRPMKYAHVGISIGAAQYRRDGTSMDDLIVAADQAMYLNKQERRTAAATRNVMKVPNSFDGVAATESL